MSALALPKLQTDRPLRRRINIISIAVWVVLAAIAILWLIPFIFMVFTAMKSLPDMYATKAYSPPSTIYWENFQRAWDTGNIATYGKNSLLITLTKVPLGIFIASLAAFAFSRMRFARQNTLLVVMVFGSMIPVQVALGPIFHLILDMGLLNTYWGILLPYIAFGLPYHIFMLTNFFRTIPRELDEAAMIDGCSRFGLYWRIIIPLSKPIIATLFILDFVSTWNEFPIALVILQNSKMWTVPLGLMSFSGYFSMDYPGLNAAVLITIIPVIIVYLIFQRYFIAGLTAGAVKG